MTTQYFRGSSEIILLIQQIIILFQFWKTLLLPRMMMVLSSLYNVQPVYFPFGLWCPQGCLQMRWIISNWFQDFPESISIQNTSVHGTPMGTTLYGSVGAHGSTTDYWAAVGVTEQKAARSCLRLMSPCEESVHERAGILVHLTAMKNYRGHSPPRHKSVY